MAARSYNGRLLNTNPTMAGTGSTTTVNSWIGDASQGWGVVQTSSGTITECTYTTYLTEDCIKLSVTGMNRSGASIGQLGISNTASYPGPTMSLSVLAGIAENVKPGKQYKLTNRYFISALAADTGSMRFVVSRTWYNSNGTRLVSTESTPDTTVSTSWETYEETLTAPVNAAYLVIRANFTPNTDPTTNGSGTVYMSDFRVTEVLPTRTTATSRTTATNRVAVRDMGTALRFAPLSTNKVTVPTSTSLNTISTETTVAMWVYRTSIQTSANEYLLYDTSNKWFYRIDSLTGGLLRFYYDGTHSILNGPKLPLGWSYIVTTLAFNGTNITGKMYVNGTLVTNSNATGTSVAITGGGIIIGNDSGSTSFRGTIDEPSIWNRALTATEIQNLYLNNIVPQDGLVAEYLFDEATGTTALDTSGNSNHGTITGATYTTDTPLRPRTSV